MKLRVSRYKRNEDGFSHSFIDIYVAKIKPIHDSNDSFLQLSESIGIEEV
jgi:hypothetical protein